MSISNLFNHEQMMAISTFYNERHRHYHTLEHIHHCLSEYDDFLKTEKQSWNMAIELAIWFHDIVYNPRAKSGQNEADSVVMFKSVCRHEKHSMLGKKVEEMILATASHHHSSDSQVQIMLDIDMSILGASEEAYKRYASQIRQEYSFLPKNDFERGREAFLRGLWRQPHIFQTEFFRSKYESRARNNIESELYEIS